MEEDETLEWCCRSEAKEASESRRALEEEEEIDVNEREDLEEEKKEGSGRGVEEPKVMQGECSSGQAECNKDQGRVVGGVAPVARAGIEEKRFRVARGTSAAEARIRISALSTIAKGTLLIEVVIGV